MTVVTEMSEAAAVELVTTPEGEEGEVSTSNEDEQHWKEAKEEKTCCLLESIPCCNTFWFMLFVLSGLAFFASSIATGAITATLTAIEDEYGIKPTLLGVIVTMYDAAYILTALPTAHYLTRNMPVVIGTGMLLFAGAAVVYGAGRHLAIFILAQFVMGIGATPLWVISFVHLDDNVADKSKMPRFLGRFLSLTPVGVILGLGLSSLFLQDCTDNEGCEAQQVRTPTITLVEEKANCSGWPYAFWILAACVLPPALWFIFSRRHYPDYLRPKKNAQSPPNPTSPTGEATDPEAVVEDTAPERLQRPKRSDETIMQVVTILLSNRQLVCLLIMQGVQGFVGNALISFGPRFFEKTLCESKSRANLYTATFIPFICVAYVVGGKFVQYFKWGVLQQWRFIALTQVMATPLFFGYGITTPWLVLLVLIPGVSLLFASSPCSMNITKRIVKEEHRSHAMALFNIATRAMGAIPGPIVMGALLDSDGISDKWSYIIVGVVGMGLAAAVSLYGWLTFEESEVIEDTPTSHEPAHDTTDG